MIGRLKDMAFGRNGKQIISIEVDADFRESFDELQTKELDIEIKPHKEKRSLNANAYFHILVNKIAEKTHQSNDAVKKQLVLDYGTLAKDGNGNTIGFKLPADVDADKIYPYTKCFDEREERGKWFKCYLVYKQTHELNTFEMSRLIDGAIYDAKELNIETATPAEIERMKSLWQQ